MSKLKDKLKALEFSSAKEDDFVFLNLSESVTLSLNGGANSKCNNNSCAGNNGKASDDNNNGCSNSSCGDTNHMNNDRCSNTSCT